jgi:aerobic carbon-monoxide dehydrogenase small subunit
MKKRLATLTINGEEVSAAIEPRMSLADFIRTEAELTGTHLGCEHGVCGACTVRLDGVTVRSCLVLAVQCEGSVIETVEGLAEGSGADLQQAFVMHNALQCGFCTPGMLMTANELLANNSAPTRDDVRDYLSGNYCRCTGYQAIVDAVMDVAERRRQT